MTNLKTAKLARWQVRTLCLSGGILWLSGAIWLWLHYFGQINGDFGPEANPVEPWMLRLHGAAMIAALIGGGSLLVAHVWRGWTYRNQRVLGSLLGITTILLILSGYGLYYIGEDAVRSVVSAVHWIIGLSGLPVFLLHYRQGRKTGRNSTRSS